MLLDDALRQIALADGAVGFERHYRVGAATEGYDGAGVVHRVLAFEGVGLRPYRPCHLQAARMSQGDIVVSWQRRTRIAGDSWRGRDVPLGEEAESYLVRIVHDGTILREDEVGAKSWTYTVAMQGQDNPPAGASVRVAQVSAQYGPGPFQRVDLPV